MGILKQQGLDAIELAEGYLLYVGARRGGDLEVAELIGFFLDEEIGLACTDRIKLDSSRSASIALIKGSFVVRSEQDAYAMFIDYKKEKPTFIALAYNRADIEMFGFAYDDLFEVRPPVRTIVPAFSTEYGIIAANPDISTHKELNERIYSALETVKR